MSDQVNKAHQATPATTLEQQIMDPNFPKNEREWWAAARIAQLEAALDILQAAMTAKKPIPMAFKKAILEARAALEERSTDPSGSPGAA